jgi:flagellar assembly protein FliH
MPVIKARDADSRIAQAEVLRFQDVEAEAQGVLAQARLQAETILAEARAHAERLRVEGTRSGQDAGRSEGLLAGTEIGRKQALDQAKATFLAEHASLAKVLAAALEQFEARRRRLLSEMERDVVALAGAIANRVIKRAVDVEPACVIDNVREALQLITQRNRLEIRLHPDDLAQAERFAKDLLPVQEYESVGFVPDPSVGRGGVLLRTAGGRVDATLETQWRRIMDEILGGWQGHWLLAQLSPIADPGSAAGTTGPGENIVVEQIDPSAVEEINTNEPAR